MAVKEQEVKEFEERVIHINRNSKVVKGGRNFSFSALVAVGNHNGTVGIGFGKANEVADAIKKAMASAHRNLFPVALHGHTIPYNVTEKFSGAKVMIRPASPGTGLIAGGAMRAVLELAGVKDALAKSLGSNNALNVTRATEKAVKSLKSRDFILEKRGLLKK